MSNWSLMTELIALLLITSLLLSLTAYRQTTVHSMKMYVVCLSLSGFSIVCNMVCVILLSYPEDIPLGVNIFMNSLYLLLEVSLCSIIALYIFEKMLEHVYEKSCFNRIKVVLVLLTAAYALLVLVNLKSGLLFWFNTNGEYNRGILNWVGYGVMAIEMLLLFACFARHHSSVGREMKHALKIFPPIVIILVIIQLYHKDLLLNGIIAAFVDIILFISFFSQCRENDNVTGIGNRDAFFSEISLRIAGKQQFQILLVFPKDFSTINRRYGYQIGNEFLYSIAGWIEKTYKEAVAFRYIGVSFAVVLPYTDEEQSLSYVKAFRDRFGKPWMVGWRKEMLAASFSDIICSGVSMEENQAMEILDYMLSLAKHSRQEYFRYDDKAAVDFQQKRWVKECLKNALDHELFEVWYQPVYSPAKKRFCSAEALVRLRDDEGRFIPPDSFIPIADELGEGGRVFWQVLKSVCHFIKENPDLPLESVSVNMSIEQFSRKEFPAKISNTLKEWEVTPEKLRFEITERDISTNADRAGKALCQMEEAGFRFYLDDFGTGYSNFAALSQYHFECVKLDKSLIDEVGKSPKGYIIVQRLIKLFHDIDINVIVEGTETEMQTDQLKELSADRIQGYYYARPMPGEELVEYLRQHNSSQTDGL